MKRLVLPACLLALSFNAQAAEIEIAVDCGITITSDVAMKRIYYREANRSVKYKISKIPNLLTATLPADIVSDLTVGELIVVNKYRGPKDVFNIDAAMVAELVACQNPGIEPATCPIDFYIHANKQLLPYSLYSDGLDPVTGGPRKPYLDWYWAGESHLDAGTPWMEEDDDFECRTFDILINLNPTTEFVMWDLYSVHNMVVDGGIVSSELDIHIVTAYGPLQIESEYQAFPVNEAEALACRALVSPRWCITSDNCGNEC
jgi:hypothetical protein